MLELAERRVEWRYVRAREWGAAMSWMSEEGLNRGSPRQDAGVLRWYVFPA